MKILYVTHAYPPHGSGVGSFVQAIARGLVARGHQVWVVETYHPSHGLPPKDRMDEGVDVRVFGAGFVPYRWLRGDKKASRALRWMAYKTKIFFLLFLFQSWRCGRWVGRLAKDLGVDLVEVPDGNESGLLAPTNSVVALVVRAHGSVHLQRAVGVTTHPAFERWVYRRLEKRVMRLADAVVGVSRFASSVAQKLFRIPEPVPVIYNLVDLPTSHAPATHDEKTVLFVGRLGADKGIDTLGKAWSIAAPQLPGYTLQLIGAGDESVFTNELSDAARATVHLTGSLPREEVFRRLSRCQLYVQPSRFESFGIALVEAMALGCVVIHSNRGSGPEIVEDSVDGILVDPDDAESLAAAIVSVLSDDALHRHLSAGALKKADNFGKREEWLDENEIFYRSVVRRKRLTPSFVSSDKPA